MKPQIRSAAGSAASGSSELPPAPALDALELVATAPEHEGADGQGEPPSSLPSATRTLRPAASIEAFVKAPVETYYDDPAFLVFCTAPGLAGVVWRSIDVPGLQRLLDAMRVNHTLSGHRMFVDATAIARVSPISFSHIARHIAPDPQRHEAQLGRRAIACPPGPGQRFVRDFCRHCGVPGPTRVFTTREESLEWLGIRDAASLLELLDALNQRSPARETQALRQLLAMDPTLALPDAAARLNSHPRTLQRRLRAQGTTFQAEIDNARIQRAQQLMRDSTRTITDIAFEVGCQSLQHFSWMFHKVTGEAPSVWRRRLGAS